MEDGAAAGAGQEVVVVAGKKVARLLAYVQEVSYFWYFGVVVCFCEDFG